MTKFVRSMLPGWYLSTDNRYTAELRPAGYYTADLAERKRVGGTIKLTRHYAIRNKGHDSIVGTARTLAEAERTYL